MESSLDARKDVQNSLTRLRNLLSSCKLALFLGEEISSLNCENNSWWNLIGQNDDKKTVVRKIEDQEKTFLSSMKTTGQSNIHNTLKTVGVFRVIFSTNMDRLIEKLIWKGEEVEKLRLDQVTELDFADWIQSDSDTKLLIKVYGDSGIVTCVNENLRDVLEKPSPEIETQLKNIFNTRSFLFLGVDCNLYQTFFSNIVAKAKVEHFMLRKNATTGVCVNGSLSIIEADLELWEFSRYISSGNLEKTLVPGTVQERSYLASQREEYLLQQLQLEKECTEVVFHTLQVCNALAPEDYLLNFSKPKLRDIFSKDPLGVFTDENVDKAYEAMLARQHNLIRIIDEGKVSVKTLFFYEEFLREVELKKGTVDTPELVSQRRYAVQKYADAILRAKSVLRPNSTLELLVVEGLTPDEMKAMQKETFAIIRLKGGIDEAVCYAETAMPGEKLLQTHLIVINGAEVHNKRKVYDRSLARAWSNKDSILKLSAKLTEVNATLHALPPNVEERLQSLNSVVSMLDSSIDAKSLSHLGGGSFGDVYKAVWNGTPVALKFLKEAAHPDDLYKFQQEFESLRQANHENIVRVYKMTVESNRLGLIMEYIEGHNLRQLLIDRGRQPTDMVMRCAVQMSGAIAHLHKLKMVHRDIKTDNLMVSLDLQTFKLADFGLARVVERTEQYKTVKGTFRYMAPEILKLSKQRGAKYSLTVDVYSYGLVLLEMVTGCPVFQDLTRDELEMGKRDGSLQPTIPEWCRIEHGCLLTEVIRRSVADVDRRPSMEKIRQILVNNESGDVKNDDLGSFGLDSNCENGDGEEAILEIVCLGTGKGTTTVFTGEPSSSFVLLDKGKPFLIVDLGFGIFQSYKKSIGSDASLGHIYITHNHADHAAELPVVLAVINDARCKHPSIRMPTVYAAPEVLHRLRTHRLPEVSTQAPVEQMAHFKTCETGRGKTAIGDDGVFSMSVLPSQHSETCYGFILYKNNEAILSYSGDSGYNRELYDQLFTVPNVILDARCASTYEHAGFTEVENYLAARPHLNCRVFLTGYGTANEYPVDGIVGASPFQTGSRYFLYSNRSSSSSGDKCLMPQRTSVTAEYLMPVETA